MLPKFGDRHISGGDGVRFDLRHLRGREAVDVLLRDTFRLAEPFRLSDRLPRSVFSLGRIAGAMRLTAYRRDRFPICPCRQSSKKADKSRWHEGIITLKSFVINVAA